MFRESIERAADKKPKTLISDGANNFHDAYRKEFWDAYGETVSPKHIREIHIDGQVHNNKMERQNGEWRDRKTKTKIMVQICLPAPADRARTHTKMTITTVE